MPECWGCQVRPQEADKCERLSGGTWDRHHVLPQSAIRKEFPQGVALDASGTFLSIKPGVVVYRSGPIGDVQVTSLPDLLGDERNMVPMRRWHHFGLEGRVGLRIHFEQIPAPAVAFAQELGLESRLRLLYPALLDVVSGAVTSTVPEFEEALRLLSELAVTPASDVEGDDLREERWEP